MKVLVLTDLYPPDVMGGYELGCRQAVDALRSRGNEVRVVTSAPKVPVDRESHVHRSLKLVDAWSHYLFVHSAPVTAHLDQGESLRVSAFNVHALLQEIEDFQPDVVYVWMLVGVGGLGLMACLHHLRIPWVWHLMDDVPVMLCKSAGRLVPTFAGEFSRQLRGHYLLCSQQLADEISLGGVRLNGTVEILPNWVVGPDLPRRKSYLEGGILKIISAASVIDRQIDKGMDLLIESAARLRELGHEKFQVEIYGRVTDGYCPHLIQKYGLGDLVFLRGSRTQGELSTLFAQADVFAFPTRAREPFGFAPLEAAARGCVPVMSHTCGIAEWFVHGVHVLKATRTAEAFARSFSSMLEGSIELSSIGRRVAAVVKRDFHLDAIIPRIEHALMTASRAGREGAGTAADAYRLAVLAERLSKVMIQQAVA